MLHYDPLFHALIHFFLTSTNHPLRHMAEQVLHLPQATEAERNNYIAEAVNQYLNQLIGDGQFGNGDHGNVFGNTFPANNFGNVFGNAFPVSNYGNVFGNAFPANEYPALGGNADMITNLLMQLVGMVQEQHHNQQNNHQNQHNNENNQQNNQQNQVGGPNYHYHFHIGNNPEGQQHGGGGGGGIAGHNHYIHPGDGGGGLLAALAALIAVLAGQGHL